MKKIFILLALVSLVCSGCTIAFHNVSTHGSATDLIDETQSNEPNVSPDISIPLSMPSLPKVPHVDIAKKDEKK